MTSLVEHDRGGLHWTNTNWEELNKIYYGGCRFILPNGLKLSDQKINQEINNNLSLVIKSILTMTIS